jgi:16S rRNA (cytosine967-C5)-methyltransferase
MKYSISKKLINNLKFLSEDIEPFLKYLNEEPIFHLLENKFNTNKNSNKRDEMLNSLNFISPLNTYELEKPKIFINTLIKDGSCYIQNTGSQVISIIASHFARNRVLDCCAAPGTKSITLKNLCPNLKIIANDIHFDRINLLKNINRADIEIMVSDISTPSCKDVFDFLIVDAPCSSSGTLRKNPDLKTKITETLINNNVDKQKHILQSIFENFNNSYVLYAVCSFIQDETEDVLDYIITKNESKYSIKTIDLSNILTKYKFKFKKEKHGYYLLPSNTLNNDMFYISLISLTPLDQI